MGTKSEGHVYWETVSTEMRQVVSAFAGSDIGVRFYLAGGTALALQLGHRRSYDLDFFSPTEDIPFIRQPLESALASFDPILADAAWGNLVYLAGDVRVGFYGYGYPMVTPFIVADGVRLASVLDIGLMKLDALQGRASRKDFHDLYAICQLVFFERADLEEPLTLLEDVLWETVKAYFRQQAVELGKSWLE